MDIPAAPELTLKGSRDVEVYFPVLDVDAVAITVWRTADGVTEAVAGALDASAAGDFVIIDYGVPFGVVSSYTGTIFDEAGASVGGLPATITVSSDEVVLSNPIDPEQVFPVTMTRVSFSRVSRRRRTEQVFVFGVAAPFEQNWGKGAIAGLPFEVETATDGEATELQLILEASPLLLRTPPKFTTIPRLLYVSIKEPEHDPSEWQVGGESIVWTLTIDEVQAPSKAIIRPLVTWDDWEAAFPSDDFDWDDVLAVYAAGSWTDAVRNPPSA